MITPTELSRRTALKGLVGILMGIVSLPVVSKASALVIKPAMPEESLEWTTQIWTTMAGKEIMIRDLTDAHLKNIIGHLSNRIRQIETYKTTNQYDTGPYTESIEGRYANWINNLRTTQTTMRRECARRNITPHDGIHYSV